MVQRIAAGNWKMNGLKNSLDVIEKIAQAAGNFDCQTLVCPPATLLSAAVQASQNTALVVGAQDCHEHPHGAYTGDISAPMIADMGAQYVIIGHSERRLYHYETDAQIKAKAQAVQATRLTPILCIGESASERENNMALQVVETQLRASLPKDANCVVAYEPIWAIGTGRVPRTGEITQVHDLIRQILLEIYGQAGTDVPLLYGGSLKASNAADIFALKHVNGALVGGASLSAEDFIPIMQALDGS